MREIKFRVWDKRTNRMHICGESTHDNMWFDENNIARYYNLQNGDGSGENGSYELMEYTGLKDKNGIEIYEGDILLEHFGEAYQLKGVVKFSTQEVGSCGCCYDEFRGSGFIAEGMHFHRCEVIGNIYENPELLRDVGKVIK